MPLIALRVRTHYAKSNLNQKQNRNNKTHNASGRLSALINSSAFSSFSNCWKSGCFQRSTIARSAKGIAFNEVAEKENEQALKSSSQVVIKTSHGPATWLFEEKRVPVNLEVTRENLLRAFPFTPFPTIQREPQSFPETQAIWNSMERTHLNKNILRNQASKHCRMG